MSFPSRALSTAAVIGICSFGVLGTAAVAQTTDTPSSTSSTVAATTTTKLSPAALAAQACTAAANHGAYVSSQPKPSGPGGRSAAAKSNCGKPATKVPDNNTKKASPSTTAATAAKETSTTMGTTSTVAAKAPVSVESPKGRAAAPGQLKKQK